MEPGTTCFSGEPMVSISTIFQFIDLIVSKKVTRARVLLVFGPRIFFIFEHV
jgi:hypothetical protein